MFYKPVGVEKNKSLFVHLLPPVMDKLCKEIKDAFEPGLKKADLIESINMMLTFNLSSYKDFKECSLSSWKEKFYDADRVFSQFTEEDCVSFVTTLIYCHGAIKDTMDRLPQEDKQTQELHKLNQYIGQQLILLDEEIKLFDKILKYTSTINVVIPPDFGKREQDSQETTFLEADVQKVDAIIIVGKMFLPLFAVMLDESKKSGGEKPQYIEGSFRTNKKKYKLIDKRVKEIYCLSFIEPLIARHIEKDYGKLLNYIEKFIEQSRSDPSKTNCTQVFRNNTIEELIKITSAYLLCRKCVKYDLSSPKTNIMGIICKGAKNVDQLSGSSNAYFPRQMFESDESSSTKESRLEIDSAKSRFTGDEEPMIAMILEYTVRKYLKKYSIDKVFFDNLVEYNIRVRKEVEEYFQMMLSSAYSNDFESCECIMTLQGCDIFKLISLTQCICFSKGWFDLGHRLMVTRVKHGDTFIMRNQADDVEGRQLKFNLGGFARGVLDPLVDCKTKTIAYGDTKSTTLRRESLRYLEDVAKYFVDWETTYQTYQPLNEAYNQDIKQGTAFVLRVSLMEQFCLLLEGDL